MDELQRIIEKEGRKREGNHGRSEEKNIKKKRGRKKEWKNGRE